MTDNLKNPEKKQFLWPIGEDEEENIFTTTAPTRGQLRTPGARQSAHRGREQPRVEHRSEMGRSAVVSQIPLSVFNLSRISVLSVRSDFKAVSS